MSSITRAVFAMYSILILIPHPLGFQVVSDVYLVFLGLSRGFPEALWAFSVVTSLLTLLVQVFRQPKNTRYFFLFHSHNASSECFWPKNFLNFMQGFKSAILAKLKNCQNGTFEPLHEIQKIF